MRAQPAVSPYTPVRNGNSFAPKKRRMGGLCDFFVCDALFYRNFQAQFAYGHVENMYNLKKRPFFRKGFAGV